MIQATPAILNLKMEKKDPREPKILEKLEKRL